MFSPRTWGCTVKQKTCLTKSVVFPTHVGVYRKINKIFNTQRKFSPRTWGCTDRGRAFSVDKMGFPHARGGVPACGSLASFLNKFSPRTWGCTGRRCVLCKPEHVFPTHVGVYLTMVFIHIPVQSFPHARGGVPQDMLMILSCQQFSPRTWGCTIYHSVQEVRVLSFPHARGGVPNYHLK